MIVEIYSDVACPWCYVGERRFERALSAVAGGEAVEVVYRPFQLDPTAPQAPVPMTDHLRRKFGARLESIQQHVANAGRAEGIGFDFEQGIVVNTFTAHRLLGWAEREYGAAVQRALAEKLFEAYFTRGADVGDHEVLVALSAAAGIDPAQARGFLGTEEGVRETSEELERSVSLGITAVPTFVFDGKYAVQGAQPTSTFLQVLEQVAAESAAAVAGASCEGGACEAA